MCVISAAAPAVTVLQAWLRLALVVGATVSLISAAALPVAAGVAGLVLVVGIEGQAVAAGGALGGHGAGEVHGTQQLQLVARQVNKEQRHLLVRVEAQDGARHVQEVGADSSDAGCFIILDHMAAGIGLKLEAAGHNAAGQAATQRGRQLQSATWSAETR